MDCSVSWMIGLLVLLFIGLIVMRFMQSVGLQPSDLIWVLRTTRRSKFDEEPRDQLERWLATHRRISRKNKPRELRWLAVSGDVDVPPGRHGRVTGIEAWGQSYIVFVKTRLMEWSKA